MRPVVRPGRSARPILDAAAGNLLAMVALHQDRPCPTNEEMRDWTGVSKRRLAPWLVELVDRGLLEIQHKGLPPARRRLRAPGGSWTGWTSRGGGR